ncbi:MAG: glycosyltransferase [Chloroflexi bacterium]|nr:glycosyltransferase [Chloroflexota bacterium]
MLQSLIGYARASGVNSRWLVIAGTPAFFAVTKRLHHALHGSIGDGSPLGEAERAVYESVLQENGTELAALVRPGDVVVLHDPQTAGLAPVMVRCGATVVWRCHIGTDTPNEQVALGWSFIAPYLRDIAVAIFSRQAYVPAWCQRSVVIQPSIDAFSPKNQELSDATVRAILVHAGLVEGPPGDGQRVFLRDDGTPGRVDRQADLIHRGRAPTWDAPLVVQVSRWDPLKDPIGVMRGFRDLVHRLEEDDTHLVLAGPNVTAVTDDPEGAATFGEVLTAWRALPHGDRRRVLLASLPMADVQENAAMVNALQRHAAVVVQKSLKEGFGLTVTEAMWKGRPIVASAVGGIRDQLDDGVHGLLLDAPSDRAAFGCALHRLLRDRPFAEQLGRNAHARACDRFLGLRHLIDYARLLEQIADGR